MATACPANNCIALAKWPVSETPMALPPADASAKRAAKAAVPEYFAVVASPTLQADGTTVFNRVTMVVRLDTRGRALEAYRKQLDQAVAALDKAKSANALSVEVLIQVPDELTQGSVDGPRGAPTDPRKGKEKAAPKKKGKDSSAKKKKKA